MFYEVRINNHTSGILPSCPEMNDFLARIFLNTDMEFSCGIIAIILIYRAYQSFLRFKTTIPFLTEENWRSIVLTSCLIASKLQDDLCMSNKDFAEIFEKESLTLKTLNSLELMMMRLLNFSFYVSQKEYNLYAKMVYGELLMLQAHIKSQDIEENLLASPIYLPSNSPSTSTSSLHPLYGKGIEQNQEIKDQTSALKKSQSIQDQKNWWDLSLSSLSWMWTTTPDS